MSEEPNDCGICGDELLPGERGICSDCKMRGGMNNERTNDLRESMQVAWLKFKLQLGPIAMPFERLAMAAFFNGFICGAEKQQAVWGEIVERVVGARML